MCEYLLLVPEVHSYTMVYDKMQIWREISAYKS